MVKKNQLHQSGVVTCPHLLPAGDDLFLGEDEPVDAGVPQLRGEGEPCAEHTLVPVVRGPGSRVCTPSRGIGRDLMNTYRDQQS